MNVPDSSGGLGRASGVPLERYPATAFVDGQGRVSLWSPEAESLLGYPAEEVLGTPAVDLLALPGEREAALAAGERRPPGQGWDGVLRVSHREGHALRLAVRVRPMLGAAGHAGWAVSGADAGQAERAKVDRAIGQVLFSQCPFPVTVHDRDLRYRWVNAATARAVGVPPERLVGRRIGDDSPHADVPRLEHMLRRVRDGGEPVLDLQVHGRVPSDPDHTRVWSASSFRLTDPAGGLLGMCQWYVDVTEGHRAQQRLALLSEASERIGTTLDVAITAQELADTAVPDLADMAAVDLFEATMQGEEFPPGPVDRNVRARRAGLSSTRRGTPEAAYLVGEAVAYHPGTPQARCLATGMPVLVRKVDAEETYALDERRAGRVRATGIHSLMALPLRARGTTLGVAFFSRSLNPEPYDEGDVALAEDFCSRAAVWVDNARRYTREHTTALSLQRSLLPHSLPDTLAVETAYRYLPTASHAGTGGDWFDVLPLSGARVAMVVGDVIGHDLHAAAVMGRLRTAVHTLADLELDPDEVLTQLDDLVIRLARDDPDVQGATCLYAVYDPVSRRCVLARAGHPPPALVQPDGTVAFLEDIPSGPPLGVGAFPFETSERRLEEGTLLALYTDGLVEAPGQDVDVGLKRLARALAGSEGPLEQMCGEIVDAVAPERQSDDVALLLARTHVLEADRVVSWDLVADSAQVAKARTLAARQLAQWDLEPLLFTTELIVSELVTNAIRHARGPIRLRLVRADSLICEVTDGSLSAPHLRRARSNDEGGRGLFLVAQVSSRWGTRYGRDCKTIWAEQPLSGPPR